MPMCYVITSHYGMSVAAGVPGCDHFGKPGLSFSPGFDAGVRAKPDQSSDLAAVVLKSSNECSWGTQVVNGSGGVGHRAVPAPVTDCGRRLLVAVQVVDRSRRSIQGRISAQTPPNDRSHHR